mmetsp:Transcript_116182/g.200671  ORF Transcript_116182/g.200671 Transcript_116182/m.200671 type:complete len:200 (-) Transcript_116182:269-868(-)
MSLCACRLVAGIPQIASRPKQAYGRRKSRSTLSSERQLPGGGLLDEEIGHPLRCRVVEHDRGRQGDAESGLQVRTQLHTRKTVDTGIHERDISLDIVARTCSIHHHCHNTGLHHVNAWWHVRLHGPSSSSSSARRRAGVCRHGGTRISSSNRNRDHLDCWRLLLNLLEQLLNCLLSGCVLDLLSLGERIIQNSTRFLIL